MLEFREKLINLYIEKGDLIVVVLKFLIGLYIFKSLGF